ncbi:MAG: 16S rRNA (guanine(966)-N(2))-methyltransferase RsmD [Syntrophales bacterium]|nr:16S rRNA (guanine(966)-N(2))-methyltransferase RsmD [Syntrophales bacterium]
MKICGGKVRGRSILMPKGGHARVTTDLVKEALFNILGSIEDLSFLDIFAGSGNVGIEALSRGAGRVTFIENNAHHLAVIRKNLEKCGFSSGFDIMAVSFERGISLLRKRRLRYNIVFADPPYERGFVDPVVVLLGEDGVLEPGGIVAVEHSIREDCRSTGVLMLESKRRYGDTVLSFLKTTVQGDSHE